MERTNKSIATFKVDGAVIQGYDVEWKYFVADGEANPTKVEAVAAKQPENGMPAMPHENINLTVEAGKNTILTNPHGGSVGVDKSIADAIEAECLIIINGGAA